MTDPDIQLGTVGPTQPPGSQFATTVERVEEKDWQSVWWPDHLMGWYPHSIWTEDLVDIVDRQPSPHTMFETIASLGYAAAVTEDLQIGTHVTQPLRRHPIVLAQAFQTLHHLTDGRMILGIGAGEIKDSVPYDVEFDWLVSKFEESIELIRLAWESGSRETFDYDGQFWELEDAVFGLPPVETDGAPTHPPIWIGAYGPRMLEITGKLGDGWLPSALPVDKYQDSWERIAETARSNGRNPGEITKALSFPIVIDETTEDCEDLLDSLLLQLDCLQTPASVYKELGYEHPLGEDFHGLTEYVPSRIDRETALEAAENVPLDVIKHQNLWGSPDDVVATLSEFADSGVEHFILLNQTHLADIERTGASFNLLDEVLAQM